jgi:hypothetical protein
MGFDARAGRINVTPAVAGGEMTGTASVIHTMVKLQKQTYEAG